MVSNTVIASMIVQLVITTLVPIIALVYFRKKYNISLKVVLVGVMIFMGFSQILQTPLHFYLFDNDVTAKLLENPFIYATYAGLSAAIFEGAGRFIAFLLVLKAYRKFEDGLGYGLGHGGIESILIGGLVGVQNLVFAFSINSGDFTALVDKQPELMKVQEALINSEAYLYAFESAERMMALILQVAFALLMLYGVKHKNYNYVLYCVLFHAFVDFFAALYQKQVINLFVVEGIFFVCTIVAIFVIRNMKEKLQTEQSES